MKIIQVMLVNGDIETKSNADYFIQDDILTVYREEKYYSYREKQQYYPFKMHIPMKNVLWIEEIERDN